MENMKAHRTKIHQVDATTRTQSERKKNLITFQLHDAMNPLAGRKNGKLFLIISSTKAEKRNGNWLSGAHFAVAIHLESELRRILPGC
jgi:hypothetical protein